MMSDRSDHTIGRNWQYLRRFLYREFCIYGFIDPIQMVIPDAGGHLCGYRLVRYPRPDRLDQKALGIPGHVGGPDRRGSKRVDPNDCFPNVARRIDANRCTLVYHNTDPDRVLALTPSRNLAQGEFHLSEGQLTWAGGMAAISLGLAALTVHLWAGPSHTFNGLNYANIWTLPLTAAGWILTITGLALIVISVAGDSIGETPVISSQPETSGSINL
jgi:hypothetical protein